MILGLHPANDRRLYKVTWSPIGWTQTQNQPDNSIQELPVYRTNLSADSACLL